jgi:glycerophosphoryl diester phosphodiesterase
MQRDVVIMSFAPVVCATTLLEAPELRTELLACSDKNDPGQWPQYLVLEKMLNAPGFNPGLIDVTPELVRDLHARGKTIAVWTVNDPADMQRLIAWGVDTLISDKPDVALRAVREKH